MGELLSGQETSALIERLFFRSFDYNGSCVLYPVRHHSPACSLHLKNVIADYRPSLILIEGPANATPLLDFMTTENTKPPFCIYVSYDDKEGRVSASGEPDKYRAYYPFLEYSPELTAVREAKKQGIPCRFIDLSYGEMLLNAGAEQTAAQKEFYQDDQTLSLGDYYRRLVEKTGCKSFHELWEMLFEITGCGISTKEFVRNVFAYCYYSRISLEQNPEEMRQNEVREQVMKEYLSQALENHEKVLVVTGGIHTVALARFLESRVSAEKTEGPADKERTFDIVRLKPEDSPAYLMPYSFAESDQASGYSSGMPYPYFYQKIWENLSKQKKTPYEETVLWFIVRTAGILRKKQALSIADEMQSTYMAKGLASLRGKRECGVSELIDGVKSAFVKGEMSAFHQPALQELFRLLTGIQMGRVDGQAGAPPIVSDFLQQCRRFRIPTNTTLKKETRLNTYNNAEHMEKSRFFQQMLFLNTGFCTLLKSQEENGSTGRIMTRETWEWRYGPHVQAELINVSVYGGTLRQACLNLLTKELREEHHTASSLAELLRSAARMGLWEVYEELTGQLTDVIGQDMDFLSVAECFACLQSIRAREDQLASGEETSRFGRESLSREAMNTVIQLTLNRSFTLLYTVAQVKRADETPVCEKVQYLYQYFASRTDDFEEAFLSTLQSVYDDMESNTALCGVCAGALLKKNRVSLEEVFQRFSAYVQGTEKNQLLAVSFLKGFFMTAKDVIFVDDSLLLLLDDILRETRGELFLEMLPELRLAFTGFLPFEIDRIAKRVSELYGVSSGSILYGKALDPQKMEEASVLDAFCGAKVREWLEGEAVKSHG